MSVTNITSDDLIPINTHFRISAGPGAGKTTWLISHMRQVLQKSNLGRTKKICCITYTNVAVDTISRKLGYAVDKIEVLTIHSFLYKHIVKPYGKFIASSYGLNIEKVDGHDDHRISQKNISGWINNHPNANSFVAPYTANQMTKLENNKVGLSNWLKSLHYKIDGSSLSIAADNSKAYYFDGTTRRVLGKAKCLDKLTPGLMNYKKIFWAKGVLHHDDVLFFGYTLLKTHPFILEVIRAKFPYLFIDEFQDTSPIQTLILNLIGAQGTIIGLIGDKAQSIYGFQGAAPEDFSSFSLPNLVDYIISDNWRSTNEIVTLLNGVRTDIRQNPKRGISNTRPMIYVGDSMSAYGRIGTLLKSIDVATLSWDNVTANSMKRNLGIDSPSLNLIDELYTKDSNSDRRRAVISSINAVEFAKEGRFKDAIKTISRNFFYIEDSNARKKKAFTSLTHLLEKYTEFQNQPLTKFYELVKSDVTPDISKLSKGAAATFFASYTYAQVAAGVNIADDNSLNRTIHRSKGDEFNNVMLILKEENDLNFIINPGLNTEEKRLYYVAISRAKERLFINVPELSSVKETSLSTYFDIIRL